MTEVARIAFRFSETAAALSAATVHTHHFTSMSHKEIRKMLRIIGHALITIAAVLVSGAVAAQVGTPPPPPTVNGWTYSTIESNVQVTGISQVLTGSSDSTGQTHETQHVAYSHDQGLVRYATRSNSNGGAWTSNWTLHPWGLICADPSLAVDNTGRPFIHCIEGNTVKVAWREPSGYIATGYVDFDAIAAIAGTVALGMNSDGSLRAIHVIYQKRGPTSARVVAHRYCTTFPNCMQPSDWRGANEVFPISALDPSKIPLVATSSTSVQAAVVDELGGGRVAFVQWNANTGWDSGSIQALGSVPAGGASTIVFKRNANGKTAAVQVGTSIYVIDWNAQGVPYRYHKVSGNDLVLPVNFDVLLTSPGHVSVVYLRGLQNELVLARRGPLDTWSREVVLSQDGSGYRPRMDRTIDGKFLITFLDDAAAKLRSVYR